MVGVDPTDRQLIVDWTKKPYFTEVAPVLYWKVRLVGFVNAGPISETKVFKCLPGGKIHGYSHKSNTGCFIDKCKRGNCIFLAVSL